MMPSLDHCVNNPPEMTTLTKTLEVFDTYKHRDDKDSDEESFHLPLDDDDIDTKIQEPVKNGTESEDEILDKFETRLTNGDHIDPQLEETLLKDDEEDKKDEIRSTTTRPNFDYPTKNENDAQDHSSSRTASESATKTEKASSKDVINEDSIVRKSQATISDTGMHGTEEREEKNNDKSVSESCEKIKIETNETTKSEKVENIVPITDSEQKNIVNGDAACAIDISCDKSIITHSESNKEDLSADDHAAIEDDSQNESTGDQTKSSKKKSDLSAQTCEDNLADNKSLEKCENSNDSTRTQNEDSEDLFDVSVIRDAEEDNAECAYNEAHSEDNHGEEHEDEDDRSEEKVEEDSGNEKSKDIEDEDEEEMDIDKPEEHLRNDDVDIEEDNLDNGCDDVKNTVCDDGESENSNKTDLVKINDKQNISELHSVEKSAVECTLDEVTGALISVGNSGNNLKDKVEEVVGSPKESSGEGEVEGRKSLKRAISDEDELGAAKKSRTVETAEVKEAEKPKEKQPLKSLLSLSDFMRTKRNNKRLSMHDLEEFCVQKICEAIVHKSELGDVHHQLKLQEQLIETMRKEIQQLTKQARDLEIVNKKLMNDLKQQTATQKPLNPLKITRSVGLQVKFQPSFEANMKRRQANTPTAAPQKVPQQTTSNKNQRAIPNATVPPVNRQVSSPQKQTQQLVKPNTPLLSQALQNRRAVVNNVNNTITNQAVRPKPIEPKNGAPSASVIDLTDEDDKKDKNKNNQAKVVNSKNITTVPLRTTPMRVNATAQGIRLATPQGKVTPITSVVTSSAPQVMYVVQSSQQNVLTSPLGPKAVVVNFQSANGVLSSTLNGSAVSVIPKQGNTIQLKPVSSPKPLPNSKVVKIANKHPAPLPPPPVVRINADKPLKPIPPKPHLTIRKTDTGIILQWKMPYELDNYEVIASYQLYAYQETSALPSTDMWRKVGDVKALALPMACTLTQFADKNKYYFAVRPVDIHKRIGMFSEPEEISL